MVLKKRDRNGDFVPWASSSQHGSSPPTMSQPYPSSQTTASASTPATSQNSYAGHTTYPSIVAKRDDNSQPAKTSGTTPPNPTIQKLPAVPPAATSYNPYIGHANYLHSATADDNPQPAKKPRTSLPKPTTQTPAASILPPVVPVPRTKQTARKSRAKKAALPIPPPSYNPSPVIPVAGPSGSQPVPTPTPAPTKWGRAKKAPGEAPEKRGAVFKPRCPQNILDRVERVRSQRIFMIDRQRTPGQLREEFSVLGSTGNVYTVTIDHRPRCDCPDAVKGNHCKHILFIFLKVLQVTQASGYWYQKALLTSELQDIFTNAPLAPNSVVHPHIREAHARAIGRALPSASTSTSISARPATATPQPSTGKKRIPGPEDDCPVCYDKMHQVAQTELVFCEDCGNPLHRECFQQWRQTALGSGKELTCVWCRAKWSVAGSVGAGAGGRGGAGVGVGGGMRGVGTAEGYLNLAGVAGVSPVRDTSTYYHGPRRGQRYLGYHDYD